MTIARGLRVFWTHNVLGLAQALIRQYTAAHGKPPKPPGKTQGGATSDVEIMECTVIEVLEIILLDHFPDGEDGRTDGRAAEDGP